jgi:hypothetical protein
VLLFAPKVEMAARLAEGDDAGGDVGSTTRLMATDNFDDRWADVGFWVTPEGRVSDVEVLRSRGILDWTKPLLRSIAGRLYSPTEKGAGTYRVERYSLTSRWMYVTGTRMRQRAPNPRIEMVDLTADQPAGTN